MYQNLGLSPRNKLCSMTARTAPAVPSGRSVNGVGGSDLSVKLNISFSIKTEQGRNQNGRSFSYDELQGLGREEAESILAEQGQIEVGCDFCGQQERFDAVDVGRLFTPVAQQSPQPGSVQ